MTARVSPFRAAASSEAMLSGQKPPFRLLVRALHAADRTRCAHIRFAVSEAFVVSAAAPAEQGLSGSCAVRMNGRVCWGFLFPLAFPLARCPSGGRSSLWLCEPQGRALAAPLPRAKSHVALSHGDSHLLVAGAPDGHF